MPRHSSAHSSRRCAQTPGKHTVATYHNEVRSLEPARFDVEVDGKTKVKNFTPSFRATNDYEVAGTFFEVAAAAGKDVVIRFLPAGSGTNHSLILNGFEIDSADPRAKAIEPSPANNEEHWPAETALAWTAPASAKSHQFYFGTDSNAVAAAKPSSPEPLRVPGRALVCDRHGLTRELSLFGVSRWPDALSIVLEYEKAFNK